jgi:plastocyanin
MGEGHRYGVAAIASIVLAAAASACSASGAESRPSPDPSAADVTIISRDMAFDQETLTVAAGSAWRLQLVNEDSVPHNVAIYRDTSATETVFVGKLVSSATTVYDMPALEPGTYFFRCDLHPEMKGTLIVPG